MDSGHKCTNEVLKPGERCGIVLVGSPIACWLGSYRPIWKLPSAIFLFVWLTIDSLPRFPSQLYVYSSMQGPDILAIFSTYVFYAICIFRLWVQVTDCMTLLPELRKSFSTVP